ncbi:dnaJ subfamily C member 17 [Amazona aestiva]|uniref:DnaJ subfamily C member 17 n=1 Tax=Amazona aestiva TaxID=12930 RepID=A0A0Q3PD25_AMAAE|nr:dnaJ subfamily C member 17 [Amazona aestiva]
MAVGKDLLQLDLYGLLGVGEKASEKEAAYDKVRKAKKQAAERTRALDEKRKKVKLDLEAREREAQAYETEEEEIRTTRSLEQEIIRLREEGSRQLQEQQRLIQEQIWRERGQHFQGKQERNEAEGKITPKLKLKWKCRKEDETRGGYSKDVLLQILQKYGDVLNLVISSRKTGSAVVEFATVKAAEMAVKNEVGLINNPLKISWLEGQPQDSPSTILPDSSGEPRTSQMVVPYPFLSMLCGVTAISPKQVFCQTMPFFHKEEMHSQEWGISSVENGTLPTRFQQPGLSSEQGACEQCSEELCGKDRNRDSLDG